MLGRTDSRARLLLLLLLVTTLSGGLMLRLAYWQVAQRQELVQAAQENGTIKDVRPAIRGTIYDRTGRVVLAQTVFKDRVVAAPAELTQSQRTRVTDRLVSILGLQGDDVTKLQQLMARDSHWVILATDLDTAASKAIRSGIDDGTLPAVVLEPMAVRVYPQTGGAPHTSLASQLLGFVNTEGKGQYGVEQAYDGLLGGKPEIVNIDPSLPLDEATQIVQKGVQGQDLRLTIDASLQLALEQEVYAAWSADRAKRVSAVVMDPKTGALLAEASYPAYDANQYVQVAKTDPARFVDPVISQVYEPGSVFKMLLASAALKSGAVTLNTKINDYGVYRLPSGQEVADANRRSMGVMSFEDIVAYSRNVGVTQAAFKLGTDIAAASKTLYATWRSYGIGSPTGIDLAAEVGGIVRDPSKDAWKDIDLANASFGQGVAVTQLQVLRAYVAMMNGGTLVRPHVAGPTAPAAAPSAGTSGSAAAATATASAAPASAGGPGAGPSASASPATAAGPAVIDPALSQQLTGLMTHVVTTVPSYKQGTTMPGYTVGGKTGTAQIWDPTADDGKGAWKDNIFNYSFYGFVGRTSPELAVGVVISEGKPLTVAQGVLPLAEESYELFRRIATDGVSALAIPPVTTTGAASTATSSPGR